MKKANALLAAGIAAAVFICASCTSAIPVLREGERSVELDRATYDVLGRVQITNNVSRLKFLPSFFSSKSQPDGLLYYKLYAAAKKQYPQADDVLNITVDYEGLDLLIFETGKYTITGLAVDYKSSSSAK